MRYTRLLILVSEATGVLAVPLGYLVVLTGFCMTKLEATRILTLGLLSDYGLCSYIHLGPGPLLLGLILVLHAVASILVMVDKYAPPRLIPLLYAVTAGLGAAVGGQIVLLWLA
jgi:hypothetical protein